MNKIISPLTLTLSPPPGQRPFRAGGQGREEAIHPPSRAGGYSGIFL